MSTPLVSIGMPVYNGEEFLAESLETLLGQTYKNLEIVVSDNASTDRTAEICQDFADRDQRIKYYCAEENRGSNWNFSQAFRLSTGDYFKWAASDDLCTSDFVERCLVILEGDATVVCCHSRTQTIDEHGNLIEGLSDPTDAGWSQRSRQRRPDGSSLEVHLRFRDVLMVSGWGVRCAGVFRSAALAQTGLMRSFYGSEKLMMAELCMHGRFYDIEEALFSQRIHSSSISGVQASNRRSVHTPLTMQFVEYAKIPGKSSLPYSERLRCYAWLAVYLLQYKKWLKLLRDRFLSSTE
ncbi:MAG: glycosyltransferase [Pseudomonadota bacterium]